MLLSRRSETTERAWDVRGMLRRRQKDYSPLINPLECLKHHTQYICGTCGRCICIEHDPKRGLQRWNFPFKSLEIAKLYLRTADHTLKMACGIYEITDANKRVSYKIFPTVADLEEFLKKHRDKRCPQMVPIFSAKTYREFPHTSVRKLKEEEIVQYMSERV